MASSGKKHTDNNKVTKKQARKVAYAKLAGAFAEFNGTVNEKKFRSKLKKASKLFAVDIAKAAKKLQLTTEVAVPAAEAAQAQ